MAATPGASERSGRCALRLCRRARRIKGRKDLPPRGGHAQGIRQGGQRRSPLIAEFAHLPSATCGAGGAGTAVVGVNGAGVGVGVNVGALPGTGDAA